MPDWRVNLQQGSWRGVPFYCRDVSNPSGQRTADFEFADSDQVYVQPLGRGIKIYKLEVYVVGDDYLSQAAQLEAALDADGSGTLIHPYLGPLTVYAKYPCTRKELSEKGRAAFFECQFVEAGASAPPVATVSTADSSISALSPLAVLLASAFLSFLFDGQSLTVQAASTQMLTSVTTGIGQLLTAPAGSAVLVQDLAALALIAPDDQSGFAAALTTLLSDYVDAIVNAPVPATDGSDPSIPPGFAGASRLPAMPSDPSFGLGALAATSFSPAAATGVIAANGAALTQLVNGSAVVALQSLYAQTDFAAVADADTARTQLYSLTVAQIAAAAGDDMLVQAWRGALAAGASDLTIRAKALPDVTTLTTMSPMPALVLAERLYQDGTQSAALVQRNAAPHPLFMPMTVEYLAA